MIFLVAFVIRGVVLWQTHPMVIYRDEPEYVSLAQYLIKTGSFVSGDFIPTTGQSGKTGDPTAFRSPVLPVFLAGHFLVFGEDLLYPRISLIFLSSLTGFLLEFIGFRLGRDSARDGFAFAADARNLYLRAFNIRL